MHDLETMGIEILVTVKYSLQENGRAERMSRTIKDTIRKILLTSGAPTYTWAECLYAVRDACNLVGRPQQEKKPEEQLTRVNRFVAHLLSFVFRA